MNSDYKNQPGFWQANVLLGTGDSAKTIKAAPGASKKLVITYYRLMVTVAAAQKVGLQDDSGTVIIGGLAASASGTHEWSSSKGVELTTNELFEIVPAAAGPEIRVYAEGYIKNV